MSRHPAERPRHRISCVACTVLGAAPDADVVLSDLSPSATVRLLRAEAGVRVEGSGLEAKRGPVPHGFLWTATEVLDFGRYELRLKSRAGYTASQEQRADEIVEGLELRSGGAAVPLERARRTMIGRSRADLNLAHRSVHTRHAWVEWRGGAYHLVALEEDWPVFVNGRRVEAGPRGVVVRLGDHLEVGDTRVEVQLQQRYVDHGLTGSSVEMERFRRQLE